MKKYFYKYISFQIIFLLIILPNIKGNGVINKDGNGRRDDDGRPDIMKILIDLKEEIQNLSRDIAKYDTLIYLLVPVSCLLFLIILGFSIHELVKFCKKDNEDLKESTKNGLYLYSKNISKMKTSSTDLSSSKENQVKDLQNSFNSSKMTESIISKDILKSDSVNQEKSQYVAPSVKEINDNQQRNDENEKYLTNSRN